MNTLAKNQETEFVAIEIAFTDDMICLILSDGREVKTPLEFYPKLAQASKKNLKNYRLMGGGTGIHWNALDEDLSVESIVLGRKAFNYTSKAT
jgi:hypothetical protein